MVDFNLENTSVPTPANTPAWTPDRVEGILKGIKELVQEYRGMKAPAQRPPQAPPQSIGQAPNNTAEIAAKAQLAMLNKILDMASMAGLGDKSLLEAVKRVPYTIDQIKEMLK